MAGQVVSFSTAFGFTPYHVQNPRDLHTETSLVNFGKKIDLITKFVYL